MYLPDFQFDCTAHFGAPAGGVVVAASPRTRGLDGVLILLRSSFFLYRLSNSLIHELNSKNRKFKYRLSPALINLSLKGLLKFHTINTYCSILEGKALLLVYFLSDGLTGARLKAGSQYGTRTMQRKDVTLKRWNRLDFYSSVAS